MLSASRLDPDGAPASATGPGQEPAEVRDRLEIAFQGSGAAVQSELGRTLASELHKALPAGSEIRQIEYRRALCRIETVHASADTFQEFMNHVIHAQSGALKTGPIFAGPVGARDSGKLLVTVAYVAEYGAELPLRSRR